MAKKYIADVVEISGEFLDSSSNAGTSGQLLSSTGTGTQWVTSGGGGITSLDLTGDIGTAVTLGDASTIDIEGGTGISTTVSNPLASDGTVTVNLRNTPVTPGSYTSANITVDAQGRITSASSGSGVTGSGTPTFLPIWNTTSQLGSSNLYHDITGNVNVSSGNDFNIISGNLSVTGGITQDANSAKIVDILSYSDFPSGGILDSHTTYVIHGTVTCTAGQEIEVSASGCSIVGNDKNKDKLVYTGTNEFITVDNVDFTLQNVWISTTNSLSTAVFAEDIATVAGEYNFGRKSFLNLLNCQFRNVAGGVLDIYGFDLVDINNSTFFYIESTSFGCRFQDVSKLEISSCEFIRWFAESSLPTPSGFATCDMIELQANGPLGAGFGAININGGIIHPQQTQFALNINSSSTTGFGTIASNAFVNVGITTGGILTGSTYNDASMLKYDVFANQGLTDSTAYIYGYQSGTDLQSASTTFGGLSIATFLTAASQRWTAGATGITYNGTKPVTVKMDVGLTVSGVGGNNEQFEFKLYKINGVTITPLDGTNSLIELDSGEIGGVKLFVITDVVQNDELTVWYRSPTNDDFILQNFSISIKQ
jgi:hypothetical protein